MKVTSNFHSKRISIHLNVSDEECSLLQCSECSSYKLKVISRNYWSYLRNSKREEGVFLH